MKGTLFTLIVILFTLSANAQKRDTIYSGCQLASDSSNIGSNRQLIFDSCPQFGKLPNDLSKYLSAHTRYRTMSEKGTIRSRIIVAFIIEKNGHVSNVKIVRRLLNMQLNNEALRVVRNMAKWKPAILHGKSVRVWYYLPVSFQRP
jgi:TonB family protein